MSPGARLREERGIIVSWILRIVLGFVVFGLALFEAGAIVIARAQVDRVAIDAAREAADDYERRKSSAKAERVAADYADEHGAKLIDFDLHLERGTLTVRLQKDAGTIVAHRLGFLRRFTEVEASHAGRYR